MKHMNLHNVTKVVVIASSTGGPKALQKILPRFPADFPLPILLVQHMPEGFTKVMAERLDSKCALQVKEAKEGEEVAPGKVLIAKSGMHMLVRKEPGGKPYIQYMDAPLREGVKPCANYLFESLADCGYKEHICVVLTGMGADGTEGIAALKQKCSCRVIAQDEESSAIYGMPKRVKEAGLCDVVLPLNQIADEILRNAGVV